MKGHRLQAIAQLHRILNIIIEKSLRTARSFRAEYQAFVDHRELLGSGSDLRTWLLRKRSKGEPLITEGIIKIVAEQKGESQKKSVSKLLKGEVPKRKGGGKPTTVQLPRDNADEQAQVLKSFGRDRLTKLRDVIHTLLEQEDIDA